MNKKTKAATKPVKKPVKSSKKDEPDNGYRLTQMLSCTSESGVTAGGVHLSYQAWCEREAERIKQHGGHATCLVVGKQCCVVRPKNEVHRNKDNRKVE